MIGSLFTSIISRLAIDAGKSGVKKLFAQTDVRRAITRTTTEFGGTPAVEPALTKWSNSDDFVDLLDDVTAGRTRLQDDALTDSFINAGGFFDGESTRESAQKILASFGRYLYDELYKGKEGLSTLAVRNEMLQLETREEIGIDLTHHSERIISEITANVREALSDTIQPVGADSSPAIEEKVFNARIDDAMKLLRQGKVQVARSMLLEMRAEEAAQNAPVNVHFRIAANLGCCALQLDDPLTARTELRTALSLKSNNHQVLSYASLSAMVLDEREEALDYSEGSCPPEENSPEIIANRIRVLHWAGKVDEIEKLLCDKPWVTEDSRCSFVLGLIRMNEAEYTEAESYLRISLRGNEENPHAHRLLAETMIIPLDDQMLKDVPLPWRVTPEVHDRVDEVERELTRSAELFEGFDNRARLHETLIQRAYIRGLLGKRDEAIEDCDRILADDKKNGEALRHKGQLLMLAGQTDHAIKVFEKIEDKDEQRRASLALAHAFSKKEQHEKVIDTLSEYWNPNERQRQQLVIAELLLEAHFRKGDKEAVRTILMSLEETWHDEPEALLVLARQRHREGKVDEAAEGMREALAQASTNGRDRITLELADLHFDEGNWGQAVELYESIVDQSEDNPVLRRYVVSLFNSGAYRPAFNLAQHLRSSGDAIPIISEIEARLLEQTGQLELARELYEQLSKLEPNKISHRLRVGSLYLRAGRAEESKRVIADIGFQEIQDDSYALLRVAFLRKFHSLDDFLPMAYRARRIDATNPDTHLGYLQIFLSRGAEVEAQLSPEAVAVDCFVRLENGKKTKTFLILKGEDIDPLKGEISSTDPRATQLLGLKQGDTVVFKEGEPDATAYTIAEVKSKYVHAFQETLSNFSDWFFGNPALRAVDVSGNDFSGVFSMLDRRAEHGREVMGLYAQRLLSMGAAARLFGKSLFELWGGFTTAERGVRVFVSVGNAEESTRESELVARSDAIVVEMTGLLTLGHLGLLPFLPRLFSRIIVAQSSLDELNEWIFELQATSKPSSIVWKEGDGYAYQEVTEEMYEHRLKFLERIRGFINLTAEIAPATAALDMSAEQLKRFEEVLGEGAIASILVAKEHGLPLYADDLGLRQVAASDWQVSGLWTQTILQRMRRCGLISAVEYYEGLRLMILSNYSFVSVDFPALWWMFGYYGKKSTSEVARILAVLAGPECEAESAVMIGAELIRRVWLEVTEESEMFKLIDDIVGALVRGRNVESVKSILAAAVHSRFSYNRTPLARILPRIEAFDLDRQSSDEQADKPVSKSSEDRANSFQAAGGKS